MTRSSNHTIQNLFLGISLIAAATISGCGPQAGPVDTSPAPRSTGQTSEPGNSGSSATASTPKQTEDSSRTLLGIQFLRLDFIVPGGLGLIGIVALLLARQASKRADEAFYKHDQACLAMDAMLERLVNAERRLKVLGDGLNKVDEEFRREDNNLLIRISRIDSPSIAQRPPSLNQSNPYIPAPPASPGISNSLPPLDNLASLFAQSSPSLPIPSPAPDPVRMPALAGPTLSVLIAALNSGDRQSLRAAARADLNITNDSESAIATGRSLATELEEVSAGGSYWLVEVDREYWLFPTDRTLKGFSASQPAKGLFRYETQIIPYPQLIEPVLLEASGSNWTVKSMGVIAIP